MQTKLTLRLDKELIRKAKIEADRRGKSVSRMVGDFFSSLETEEGQSGPYPPVTASLFGVLKDSGLSEEDYLRHLRKKHS